MISKKSKKIIIEIEKSILIFAVGFLLYMDLEVIHGFFNNPDGHKLFKNLIFVGFIGGLLSMSIGWLSYYSDVFRGLPFKIKCLLSGLIITLAELGAGYILNIVLKWGGWDYSHLFLGDIFGGLISPLYAFIWVLISPLIFWINDAFRAIYDRYYGKLTPLSSFEDLVFYYKKLLLCWGRKVFIK